jgi:hypothetical protein
VLQQVLKLPAIDARIEAQSTAMKTIFEILKAAVGLTLLYQLICDD